MHRRARHLNPVQLGAALAIDARFLTLANGASVATWTGRPGSVSATQSSAPAQPTFQTSVLKGQPVVRFSGAQVLNVGNLTSQPFKVVIISRHNNGRSYIFDGSSTTRAALGDGLSTGSANNKMEMFAGSVVFGAAQTFNTGEYFIWSSTFDGASSTLMKNGAFFASGSPGSGSLSSGMTIGNRFALSFFLDGDIATVIVISGNNAHLRRRVEQSVAFSFKIPCS